MISLSSSLTLGKFDPPTIRKLHEIQTSDMEKGNRFFSSPHEKGLKSVVPMEK